MPSETFRKIFPYISIGVGILVYVLYYMSTQSWNEAQSEYERQEVQRRLAKKAEQDKLVSNSKPWISDDGKENFKMISSQEKDGLTWIKLKAFNEGITYNLRKVESEIGEKFTSNAGNLFWMKGEEAIFENNKNKTYNLRKTKTYKGLYSYMADANSFKLCDGGNTISVAMLGENKNIESAYSKIKRAGEDVYLELEGVIIRDMSMEGNVVIDAVYPYQLIEMIDRMDCK